MAIPDTTDSLMVSWTAPVDISPAITDYDVRYQKVGSESWTELDHAGTGLSATVTGLTAGTTYAAQVRATNADGTSAWSRSGMGRTNVLPTEVPSDWSLAPSDLAAGEHLPPAVRLLGHARRHLDRHRGLQHVRPEHRRCRPYRHPGLQRGVPRRRQHRRCRRQRQHQHALHRRRQGPAHLLAGAAPSSPTTTRTSTTESGTRRKPAGTRRGTA